MDEYIATVRRFAGPFAPRGFLDCDGRLLPISQWLELFAVLGTQYGGDGKASFALPDLRDKDRRGRPVPFGGNGRPRWIICIQGILPQRP
jgi:microcystin-dependent protein